MTDNLVQALAAVQAKLPRIPKSERAVVETQKGSYSYTYADLAGVSEKILPLIGEHGLCFESHTEFDGDGRFVLAYSLRHTSGEQLDGVYPLPDPVAKAPQAVGSAITYARRYCLCAVTGAAPEDDDDAAAAQADTETKRGTAQRRTTPTRQAAVAAGDTQQRTRETARAAGAVTARGAQPPQPPLPGEDGYDDTNPNDITKKQMGKMQVLFSEIGWTDRADRLRAASTIIGREISTSNELSKDEASRLIDRLQECANNDDPQMALLGLLTDIEAEQVDGEPSQQAIEDVDTGGRT